VTTLRAEPSRDHGSNPGRGQRFSSSAKRPDRTRGPPSHLFSGYRGFSPWIKGTDGRQIDHCPPSNAKFMNAWSYTSCPLYVFMACTGTTLPSHKLFNKTLCKQLTSASKVIGKKMIRKIFFPSLSFKLLFYVCFPLFPSTFLILYLLISFCRSSFLSCVCLSLLLVSTILFLSFPVSSFLFFCHIFCRIYFLLFCINFFSYLALPLSVYLYCVIFFLLFLALFFFSLLSV
jgi:hypothetical protein